MTETSLCDGRVWLLLSDSSVGIAVIWTAVVVGIDGVVVSACAPDDGIDLNTVFTETASCVYARNSPAPRRASIARINTPITARQVPSSLFMLVFNGGGRVRLTATDQGLDDFLLN